MNPMSETTHQRLPAEVGNLSGRAIAVSREIHQDPELAFREHHAASLLTAWLENEGFSVERSFGPDRSLRVLACARVCPVSRLYLRQRNSTEVHGKEKVYGSIP